MLNFPETPRAQLRLLVILRTLAIVGQIAIVAGVVGGMDIALPTGPLFLITAGLAVVNLLTFLRLYSAAPVSTPEFFGQLLLDMLGLTFLLHLTGGAFNPFASLFILQVVIGAVSLPARWSWAAAGVAIALYSLLMVWRVDVPYFGHHTDQSFALHVVGMWLNFILLTMLINGFAARMGATLRQRDRMLAEAEQMAALGALAAGAAHELGTPLSTLLILGEAYAQEAADAPARERAALLTGQIARCKAILGRLAGYAGAHRAEAGKRMALDAFLTTLAAHWRERRPETTLEAHLSGSDPAPVIVADSGLEQALTLLLDNAADACPARVSLLAHWSERAFDCRVMDEGPGLTAEVLARAFTPGFTTKPHGLGMGLPLARGALLRLGGTLTLANNAGGAEASVYLPLARIRV